MLFFHRIQEEVGQGLVEYALILGLVAIVVIAILALLGPQIESLYQTIINCLWDGSSGLCST